MAFEATHLPEPDLKTRAARREDWIERFAGWQRIARRWIEVVDLVDWCARSTTAAAADKEEEARELAYRRAAESVLRGEFEREGKSKILYLAPFVPGDDAPPHCRLTKPQFEIVLDACAAFSVHSLPLPVLNRCWLPRELARQWLEMHGYRWPPHFEPPRPSAASAGTENRHWKPLAEAISAVRRCRGIGLDQAWTMLKADIMGEEIKARCRAKRYDRHQAQWIETWRDLDPLWLGFIAYEYPQDGHLRFDTAGAARGRIAGEQLDPPPEHARDIIVDAARFDELYRSAPEEKPAPSPLKPPDTTDEKPTLPSGIRTARAASAEEACREWLAQLTERPPNKEGAYSQARSAVENIGSLSWKAFERAWAFAARPEWKRAGRPRKLAQKP